MVDHKSAGIVTREVTTEWVLNCMRRASEGTELAAFLTKECGQDLASVQNLTIRINQYILRPWSKEDVSAYRKGDKKIRAERKDLDKAAVILERELEELREASKSLAVAERVSQLRVAIEALREPRTWFEQGFWRTEDKGQDPKPWAVMARQLAVEVRLVLLSLGAIGPGGKRAQHPLESRGGPVLTFLRVALTQIFGRKIHLSDDTIMEAIRRPVD